MCCTAELRDSERSQVKWLTASLSACLPTCLSVSMSACSSVCLHVHHLSSFLLSVCPLALRKDVITPALCLQAVLWKRREGRSSLKRCRSWRRKTALWRWLEVSVQSRKCQDFAYHYQGLTIHFDSKYHISSCLQNHDMEMISSLSKV